MGLQAPAVLIKSTLSPELQRKTCSCGRPVAAGGECAECRKKRLALQRRAVNQNDSSVNSGKPDEYQPGFVDSRFNHDFSQIRANSPAAKQTQTGPVISKPGDKYEREADRVAEQVMRLPAGGIPDSRSIPFPRKRFEAGKQNLLQTKRNNDHQTGGMPQITNRLNALNGRGRPLSPSIIDYFEPRLGYGLSQVRIHTGSLAEETAQGVDARAFALGNNIVFGAGQYAPDTTAGKWLLAHELTHTIQQGFGRRRSSGTNERGKESVDDGLIQESTGNQVYIARQPRDAGPPPESPENQQYVCVVTAACMISAGQPIWSEINENCRRQTDYEGEDIVEENFYVLCSDEKIKDVLNDAKAQIEKLAKRLDDPKLPLAEKKALEGKITLLSEKAMNLCQSFYSQEECEKTCKIPPRQSSPDREGSASEIPGFAPAVAAPCIIGLLALLAAGFILARALSDPRVRQDLIDLIEALKTEETAKPKPEPSPKPRPGPDPIPPVDVDSDRRRRKCNYPTGVSGDPIPIIWFKPRHDMFYPRYVEIMDGVLDRDDPEVTLPDGTPVGVQKERWPKVGKIIRRIKQPRLGYEGRFKRKLALFGYDWKYEKTSPDHVQDVYWNGPDEFGNLWPYESSTNADAGPRQNARQRISFCETQRGPEHVNQRLQDVDALIDKRFFIIDRIEM